ncbi:terminase [Mycobacterium colombiense]
MELIVPPDSDVLYPSLGDQVCNFLESHSVFGPGDLKGQPYKLAEDWEYVTYRAYEYMPKGHRRAGKRRFQRVNISIRKGAAKTEFLGQVAFGELHPYAPVRFNGYNADGTLAPGRPVVDPFIPLLANAKIQVEELAYGALKVICENCPADVRCFCPECDGDKCHWCGENCLGPDAFDIGVDRIIRLTPDGKADGKCVPVATSPDTNDGGRTTFNGYDETHRLYLPSEKAAVTTMDENLGKRTAQDPWGMAVTTVGEPGQQSVAEDDHFEAEAMARGEVSRPDVFYFHRQASDHWDLEKFEDRVEAVREASGPDLAERTDLERIAARWDKPKADKSYLERVWTNRWTQQGAQAWDIKRWRDVLRRPGERIKPGAYVTVGFDGARMRDATGFVVTDIRTGLQQREGLWERPRNALDGWEVPELEVNAKKKEIFKRYRVVRMYADPPHWNFTVGMWAADDPDVVMEFWTNQRRRMYKACEAFEDAIASGSVGHDSHEDGYDNGDLTRHIGNAGKHDTNLLVDPETEKKLWILTKLHPDRKIDLCPAAVLSWQARMDVLPTFKPKRKVVQRIR